ncbi:hypothetical protein [Geobacter sp.]|uniref:hypothetical protein n=1 Tax=Geobacter sp. TaxID=46610 RepID=UPI002629EB5F|nr:hypothetical protein [Geobacter sp.]
MLRGFLLLLVFLAGCATPAYKMQESDLVWEEKVIQAPYQVVYNRILSSFRGDEYARAEGFMYSDNKEAIIDIYLRNDGPFNLSPWTIGIIKLTAISDIETNVRAGVNEGNLYFSGKGHLRQEWLKAAGE